MYVKKDYFYRSEKQALKSTIRHRHGCIIVYADKKIVSR